MHGICSGSSDEGLRWRGRSGIVRGLAGPLWAVAGVAMLVGGYETLRETGQLPPGWGSISLESQAYSYSSFALSLLLVRVPTAICAFPMCCWR